MVVNHSLEVKFFQVSGSVLFIYLSFSVSYFNRELFYSGNGSSSLPLRQILTVAVVLFACEANCRLALVAGVKRI